MSVIFASKAWEKDWQKMTAGAFARKQLSCVYPFDSEMLILNNGTPSVEEFTGIAEYLYKVSSHEAEVMEFFNLTDESFAGGKNYAIGELTAIYFAKDFDYLCYLQGDCIIDPPYDWITPGIEILEDRPQISVVSPTSEVNTWHDGQGLDQFFSDQSFLVRVDEFRKPIYNEPGTIIEFPSYGGNSFEHMCAKYLRKTGKYRYILNEAWCVHPAY